jgi:spoIIIJ-associated protein
VELLPPAPLRLWQPPPWQLKKADEAKSTGASIKLAPMNAFERKIIHDTIQDLGLTSESDGEDPNRFVVIYPA